MFGSCITTLRGITIGSVTTNGQGTTAPRPVPELHDGPVSGTPPVTDDDRNRFGALLDAGAERGLLSPPEYQARLVEVAEATSVAELQRIVTELPAFSSLSGGGSTAPSVVSDPAMGQPATGGAPSAPDLDAILWAGRTPAVGRRNGNTHWVLLAIVVAVLLIALVALGLVAAHLVQTHGAGTASAVFGRLSSPRP